MKAVVKVLGTARKIATNSSDLARNIAEKLQKGPNPGRLSQSEKAGNNSLSIPSSGVRATLDAMNHAIDIGKSRKIKSSAILKAMKWALGGSIEGGRGSHVNFRWQGGVFTIPKNKDGNVDILYIKQASKHINQGLGNLLLGYAESQSTVSNSETSEGEGRNLDSISETSSIGGDPEPEETKDETPEPSESSEQDAC